MEKPVKKFKEFKHNYIQRINEGEHSEDSEKIWFKIIDQVDFEQIKSMATKHFSRDFSWCDDENDLWNELDFRGYFDEFCEILNRVYSDLLDDTQIDGVSEGKVSDSHSTGHSIMYRGEEFPGYNRPKLYDGEKNYKFRVLARVGDTVKTINFGRHGEQYSKLSKKYWEATWK